MFDISDFLRNRQDMFFKINRFIFFKVKARQTYILKVKIAYFY